MTIEELGIREAWASVTIEVHYQDGTGPLAWTSEQRAALLATLGLHPRAWVIYPRPPVRDCAGVLVQRLWADGHAGDGE
jgi:hypothetical protein